MFENSLMLDLISAMANKHSVVRIYGSTVYAFFLNASCRFSCSSGSGPLTLYPMTLRLTHDSVPPVLCDKKFPIRSAYLTCRSPKRLPELGTGICLATDRVEVIGRIKRSNADHFLSDYTDSRYVSIALQTLTRSRQPQCIHGIDARRCTSIRCRSKVC